MSTISQTGRAAVNAAQWVRWADQDYVSARSLLLNARLVQGAGLSNTAVEKYLKAVLALKGLGFARGASGHDVDQLYGKLDVGGMDLGIDTGFLKLLVKAYRLRYPDDLEPGFNVVLPQMTILAELDATVHNIRKGFHFDSGRGPRDLTLEALTKEKCEHLLKFNCVFGSAARGDLFAGATHVYAIRVLDDSAIMEVEYEAQAVDDRNFDREALKPGPAK